MLFSLLPTTALAADTYPTASEVCVDGNKYFGEPSNYYFKNNASACSNDPTGYNAYYNPTTGTLTLDGYSGGSITAGETDADITVVLKGTNTINGNLVNSRGGDITITSESGGTLSITNTTDTYTGALIGIAAGYGGSFTTGNVTIEGNAKVTIDMTHNGTNGYEDAYGIFAKENIIISGYASVDITCATPNNTFSNIYCNGLRAVKNVTIETDGEIKIDVTNAGNSDTQSFGIYPMENAVLTKVGKMEVKWKKHATHSVYPGGAVKGGASFDTGTYAINEDTTNCYASYRFGMPRKVTVQDGQLTGPGVPNKKDSGMFLVGDTVNITPYEKKSDDGTLIPFKEWTSDDVMLASPTAPNTSFKVPANAVTVTATHSPFVGAPTFTRTDNSSGTIAFQTAVKPDGGTEYFEYVKVGDEGNQYGYYRPYNTPNTTSTASPYQYSVSATNWNSGDIRNLEAGDYRMAVNLNGERYLSDPFTVNYTAATTPAATVADVTIGGVKDSLFSSKDVIITLTNDTFKSTLSGNWIANLPNGLSQNVSYTDATHAKITVSGTPTATSSAPLIIKIPAANLTSNADLTVTSNENAVFTITAPTYSVNIVAGANMSTSGTASQSGLTGAMTDVVYTADTDYYFPTDYSSVGTSDGITVTRNNYTQITVSGTPTEHVNITLAAATAKTKEATPTANFTAESENGGKLGNVDNTMKYSVDGGGNWVDITGDNMSITNVTTAKGVQVKKPAADTNTRVDSDVQTITVTKAIAPTDVTAVGCTSNSNDNGKLENVTTAMEYQKSGTATWTPCGGTEVANLTNGAYLVRVKATGMTLASDNQTVIINAYGTTPAAQPDASFTATGRDAGTLVISGTYTSTMQYSVDGGIVWKNVTSASMDIIDVTAADGIQVKDVGNGSTTSASTVKSITVTEGAKPTGLTVTQPNTIGGKGKIETTASHEYKTDGGTTFTSCTGALDNLTAGDYHVRVKAAGTMLASETETYTITAFTGTPETQPGATFTATGPDSGTLSSLVDGGNYAVTGVAAANFTASGTTHDLTGVAAGTLSIVKKGDGITTTDSAAQTIPVAKAATPSTVTAVGCTTSSNNDGKLQNVTTDMEYQKSGDSTWTACGGSEVTGLTNGTYLVRVKATGTTLASDNQSVVVAVYTGGGTSGGTSSGGSSGGGYVPTTQKPEIKADEGGSIVLSKDGTTATITPNAGMMIDKIMLNGKDMGALTVVKGIKTGDKLEVSFKQTAEEKAKMDKAVAEQVAKAGLTARSARTAKKNVKLVVQSDLDGITDAGYTVEYKFYRSTKKSAGYKAMKTGKSGIYINTYGKKGTLYYYKVKVMVYDKDGNLTAQTTLKQCKYASRLWTK